MNGDHGMVGLGVGVSHLVVRVGTELSKWEGWP